MLLQVRQLTRSFKPTEINWNVYNTPDGDLVFEAAQVSVANE